MSATSLPIHPGAQEHYENASSYQRRYQGRTEDIEFYLKKIPVTDKILEYGAGAGRLTLPLAARGNSVMAVDASPSMFELLRTELGQASPEVRKRVKAHCADMRTFRTRARFNTVVAAFHTVCHLYAEEDMNSFLRAARRHLISGGRLTFDLPLPRIDVPGYDPISQVKVTEMDGPDGPELLTQRWFHPQEVQMYLHYNGFKRIRLQSDFTSEGVSRETSVYTVTAVSP